MQLDAKMVRLLRRGAAFGAYAVTGGLFVVYLGVVALTRTVPTGGMNPAVSAITWICVFVPVLALAVVHIVFARQLLADAPGQSG
ncbi:MAG: hypothetical protein ACHQTF_06500 [Gemmatimonadales bacterium]|jgi:hypothetical protein